MEDGYSTLSVRKRSYSHHGGPWGEGIPSGERSRRAASWKCLHRPQVKIDYGKLKELCTHKISSQEDLKSKHDRFMAEYSSIFQKKPAIKRSSSSHAHRKTHSCTSMMKHQLSDISDVMIAIHGREKEEQIAVDLEARLKIMLKITRKRPIQRRSSEVKQLAQLMGHFPSLLPNAMEPEILTGVAARAQIEITEKGYSLPNHGGSYLILQGTIEKLTMGSVATELTAEMVNAGETFGVMKECRGKPKSSYPIYVTKEPCMLMRITAFNYEKVVESCKNAKVQEKQQLVKNCPLLHHVSPSVLTKLANDITWEKVPANTTILSEGQTLTKIGFIQEGKCVAYAHVSGITRQTQVHIGDLGPGDCIGEVLLRGNEKQPYTIIATSHTRIGWVKDCVIRVNEVEKHILSDKPLALPTLSQDDIRNKYADKLMKRQWDKIRQDIVSEVITEKGIRLGSGRWRHSRSYSEGERPKTSMTARQTPLTHIKH